MIYQTYITQRLLRNIEELWPEEFKRVWDRIGNNGDIDDTFVGFIDIYEALAHIIPKDRIIYDVGCAYSLQAYYFRDHRAYVGIDVPPPEEIAEDVPCFHIADRLHTPNSKHYERAVADKFCLLDIVGCQPPGPSFAICSYVPDNRASIAVRQAFTDCFVYYPSPLVPHPLNGIRKEPAK